MHIVSSDNKISNIIKLKLEQCYRYLDKGFSLIPLQPGGKIPFSELLPKDDNGRPSWKILRERKASRYEIEGWLRDYPDINIGIITGKASRLVVLDIDHRIDENGLNRLDIDSSIETPTVITGRNENSQHIYFRTDSEIESRDIFAGEHKVGELMAEGRYIVAPPSKHPSGQTYQWKDKNSLIRTELLNYKSINYITRNLSTTSNNILFLVVSRDNILNTGDPLVRSVIDLNDFNVDSYGHTNIKLNQNINSWWQQLQRQPEIAKKILKLAGVEVKRLGKAFKCPFHEDNKPSASLFMVENEDLYDGVSNGYIGFADFHKKGRPAWYDPETDMDVYINNGDRQNWFNLAEVFYAIETGNELQKLDAGVGVVWWFRALDKIGEISSLPSIQARKLPDPDKQGNYLYKKKDDDGEEYEYIVSQKSVKKVYEGFKYLLQLRALYNDKQAGTPFSHRFAASWCDVSAKTAGKAMRYLLQKRLIIVKEERKGMKANVLDIDRR